MDLLRSKFILPLFALIILLIFPISVFAQAKSFSAQEEITLGENEIIDHDYFAAGNRVTIDGTVNGDAYIAGGQVDINGTINGDLLIAGGQVTIRGTVSQDVRGAGGNVLVLGDVGRNVTLVGGNLTIDRNATIAGNAVGAGGNIEILSEVKNLTIAGGNARVDANIPGDVTGGIGNLDISRNTVVGGDLEYWSSNKARIASGASILGKTSFHKTQAPEEVRKTQKAAASGISVFFSAISFISTLILGILLIWLLPVFSAKTADIALRKFWLSLLAGFFVLIFTPILVLSLMITIIGFPAGLILLLAYGVVLYISKIFVALAVGTWINTKAKWKLNPIWAFIVGLILYYALGFIPVLGGLIKFIVLLIGIGALIVQKKYYYLLLRDKKLI